MGEFKGTKGKWILNWDGSTRVQDMLQIINNYGYEVCNFGDSESFYPSAGVEPNKYDALLISKAPEMLEMLIELSEINSSSFVLDELKERAKQLIKEATEI